MSRRYRIKSAPRFITFVTICTLIIIFAFISLTGMNDAEGLSDNTFHVYDNEYMPSGYHQIKICAGDTLWDIAAEYGPDDMDIREAIYAICDLNGIEAGHIQAGDILMLPIDFSLL